MQLHSYDPLTREPSGTAGAPQVSIVVLNWNGRDDTLACLGSIAQSSYPAVKVIVADNGSEDDSVSRIRGAFPAVQLMENGANLGFAAGNNRGIEAALAQGAEFVLLLNNDALIAPGALEALLADAAQHPRAGVFSGRIVFGDGSNRIWYAGARWHADRQFFEHVGYGKPDGDEYAQPGLTDYASGCAFFVRAEVFKAIGLLDERFFLTYEESDFCYRARGAGFECRYVPAARFEHKVSASFGGESTPLHDYFYTRNLLLWAERHLPKGEFLRLLGRTLREILGLDPEPRRLLGSPRRLLWALTVAGKRALGRGQTRGQRARYLGLRDYLTRRFGDCPQEVRGLCKAPVAQGPA